MLQEALSKDPNHSDGHIALGKIYERKGLIDEAIEELKLALKNPIANFGVYFSLGLLHEKKKKTKESI